MFVHGKPFQPSVLFVGKARSLPQSGASERFFDRVGSSFTKNIRLFWKGLPVTNTLAYYKIGKLRTEKVLLKLGPGPNVIRLFCP